MSELYPCPFCGCEEISMYLKFHPQCIKCGAIQDNITGRVAVDSWNTRANAVLIRRLEREYNLKFQSDGSLLHYNGEKWCILESSNKERRL